MSWQIPAGPPAQPTLVPWKTMQEELPNALGTDDESLPDHCQCAPLKVIYYSQYCLGSANNSCTSQLAAPACSSQRKQSGHWSTMWVFFSKLLFLGYLLSLVSLKLQRFSGQFSSCAFVKGGQQCSAQKSLPSNHCTFPEPGQTQLGLFCGKKWAKGQFQERQALHVKWNLDPRILSQNASAFWIWIASA